MAVVANAPVKGYLVLELVEATGKSRQGVMTWDAAQGASPLEAFVKVELWGGPRKIKAQTKKALLVEDGLEWHEKMTLEVLEGCQELRVLLCRERMTNGKKGTTCIAACGIFLQDIQDAVPLDKYFEMFKPKGGDGGYVRMAMNFTKEPSSLVVPGLAPQPGSGTGIRSGPAALGDGSGAQQQKPRGRKRVRAFKVLVLTTIAAGVGYLIKQQRGPKSSRM